MPLPKYFTVPDAAAVGPALRVPRSPSGPRSHRSLRADGSWLSPLGTSSHLRAEPEGVRRFAQTLVGDLPTPRCSRRRLGISTPAFIRNMERSFRRWALGVRR